MGISDLKLARLIHYESVQSVACDSKPLLNYLFASHKKVHMY